MKKSISILFLALFGLSAFAQDFPAPSPKAMVSQVVGVTEITVEYSSPGVKGRELFGDLMPYGEVWRTGANKATAITFEDAVKVGGNEIAAGTYSIFTIPKEDGNISILLNSETELWGTGNRDNGKDVLGMDVKLNKEKESIERMRFTFENTTNNSTDLKFAWGNYRFTLPIETNTARLVDNNLNNKIKEFDQQYEFYADAARYYYDEGNYPVAEKYGKISVDMNEKFWNTHTLAKIYKELGKKDLAKKWAEKSLDLSKKADYKPYIERNEKLLSEL
jgi:tetratricopeptide (TPR) repeat protein